MDHGLTISIWCSCVFSIESQGIPSGWQKQSVETRESGTNIWKMSQCDPSADISTKASRKGTMLATTVKQRTMTTFFAPLLSGVSLSANAQARLNTRTLVRHSPPPPPPPVHRGRNGRGGVSLIFLEHFEICGRVPRRKPLFPFVSVARFLYQARLPRLQCSRRRSLPHMASFAAHERAVAATVFDKALQGKRSQMCPQQLPPLMWMLPQKCRYLVVQYLVG